MVVKQVHERFDLVGIALVDSLTFFQLSSASLEEAVVDVSELLGEFGPDFDALRVGQVTQLYEFAPASHVQLRPDHVDQ